MVKERDRGEVSKTVKTVQTSHLTLKVVMSVEANRENPNYVTLLIFRGNIPREISWHHRRDKTANTAVKKQTFKVAHEVTDMYMNKRIISKH